MIHTLRVAARAKRSLANADRAASLSFVAKMFSGWSTRSSRFALRRIWVFRWSRSRSCTRRSACRIGFAAGVRFRAPTVPPRASTLARSCACSGPPISGSACRNPPIWSSGTSNALARVRNGSGSSPIRATAIRKTSTFGVTPGVTSRGATPARISDDFPAPLSPTIRRNGTFLGLDRASERGSATP